MISIEKAYVHSFNLKKITTNNGEERTVFNARVLINRSRYNEETDQYDDKGSFWVSFSLWGRAAEAFQGLNLTGARLLIVGELAQESWTDRESGETRTGMRFNGREAALLPGSIESVKFKEPKSGETPPLPEDTASEPRD